MLKFTDERLGNLLGLLKRRGILAPAFEIHGGAKGLYEYGPIGGRLLRNLSNQWVEHFTSLGDIVEISSPTVTPYAVLEASGHVGEFTDSTVTCIECHAISRADHLLAEELNPDNLTSSQLSTIFLDNPPECPECGSTKWSEVTTTNLMFNTNLGIASSAKPAFLRPETAQGMFTSFSSIYRHFREKLPFGAMQVGKGYRNEISPRQGMIRLREFNMAEIEYFIDPNIPKYERDFESNHKIMMVPEDGEEREYTIAEALEKGIVKHAVVGFFLAETVSFLIDIGIDLSLLRLRQHQTNEMAHYAQDCWDVELFGSYGWIECVGVAHRGCFDLEAHEKATNQRLRAWRDFSEPKEVSKKGWTIDGSRAGPAFRQHAPAVKTYVESLPEETEFPQVYHIGKEELLIAEEHVKRIDIKNTINGEWFLPHVVEPAFGLDRIMWHIIDHAYFQQEKEGSAYHSLRLSNLVTPMNCAVFPLFDKDGMGEMAKTIHKSLNKLSNFSSFYDASGSIGRRYARADEIGIPFCITIDHQSLDDESVTIRYRDSGDQERLSIGKLEAFLR